MKNLDYEFVTPEKIIFDKIYINLCKNLSGEFCANGSNLLKEMDRLEREIQRLLPRPSFPIKLTIDDYMSRSNVSR